MTTLALSGQTAAPPQKTAQGGLMTGSLIGSSLFKNTNNSGSRLSDLKVQSSAYGNAIPIVFGSYRVAGNVIWSTNLQQVGTGTSYMVSCAIAICAGPVVGVTRVWADNKLIYNARTDIGTQGQALPVGAVTFYPGSETQLPDPTIEAYEGAGNVPAHRGIAYVVLTDLQLALFGNRLPNFTFEVGAPTPVPLPVRDVVAELSRLCGMAPDQLDVASMQSVLHGFALTRQQPCRAALEPLMKLFRFDAVESSSTVKFVERGNLPALVLSMDTTIPG
jgi:hypothetical protein